MTSIFFCESSPNMGGQELQLLAQATGLKNKGYMPFVLCRADSRVAQEARKLGLNIESVAFKNALHFPSVLKLVRLLKIHKPVAMVCHSSHDANLCSLTVHALAKAALLKPRPVLIRMRTYQPGPAKAFTYNQMFDCTFTPSLALKNQLLQNSRILPSKIAVLYPGVDFKGIATAANQQLPSELENHLKEGGQGPVIVHAAMFRPEKGHSFMLEVVKALLPRFPDLLYVAAGEGETEKSVARQVRQSNLGRHVCLTGMLNPVAPLFKKANVLVMPSGYEPLGMSQIEALGLGIPVVVSNVGGLPETVQDGVTGHVCPVPSLPDALDAWVQVLSNVFAQPARSLDMAAQGRQWVLEQFDRQKNLACLIDTIESLHLSRPS